MFWFLLLGLLLVIGGVTLAVVRSGVGEGDGRVSGGLSDPVPERLAPVLPAERPLVRGDVDALRLPLGLRGYRMEEVDDVLDRLGAELSERDSRIAGLEASLAGNQATALGRPDLFTRVGEQSVDDGEPAGGEPTGGEPATGEPATGEPATDEPATDELLAGELEGAEPPADHDELAGWGGDPSGAERAAGDVGDSGRAQGPRHRSAGDDEGGSPR